jgi:hypothetical protein
MFSPLLKDWWVWKENKWQSTKYFDYTVTGLT